MSDQVKQVEYEGLDRLLIGCAMAGLVRLNSKAGTWEFTEVFNEVLEKRLKPPVEL